MKRWLLSFLLATIGLSLGVFFWRAVAADREALAHGGGDAAPLTQPSLLDSAADAAPGQLPQAVVPEEEFDFGVIDVGAPGEHAFVVRNEGQADLLLRPGSSSCECTLVELPQGVIPPGGEGRVRLEWLAPESNERFRHGATVLTNDPQRPRLLFVVSGRVRRHIVTYPPDVVVFSNVLPGQRRSNRALIYSEAYEAFDLGEIESTHPYIAWEVVAMDAETLGRLGARSGYEIKIRLDSTEQLGRYGGHLALRPRVPGLPDDEQPPPRQLNVFSDVVGRVRVTGADLDDRLLPIGLLTRGEGARRTVFVSVAGDRRELNVGEIETTPEFLRVRVAPDGEATETFSRYRVDIEVPADAAPCNYMRPGMGEVRIATDHPDLPELVLQVEFAIVPAD